MKHNNNVEHVSMVSMSWSIFCDFFDSFLLDPPSSDSPSLVITVKILSQLNYLDCLYCCDDDLNDDVLHPSFQSVLRHETNSGTGFATHARSCTLLQVHLRFLFLSIILWCLAKSLCVLKQ